MTDDITIPPEALEAALKKRGLMREAIAAAINAWPGIKEEHHPNITFDGKPITVGYIILPLTQEKTNAT